MCWGYNRVVGDRETLVVGLVTTDRFSPAAARVSDPNRIVARIDLRGCTAAVCKRSAEALANWMEEQFAERLLIPERIEGGIIK